jgi:hypothetical protein
LNRSGEARAGSRAAVTRGRASEMPEGVRGVPGRLRPGDG